MAYIHGTSFKVETPARFKYHCRALDQVVWHTPRGTGAVCEGCGRVVPAAEVITIYSVSDTRTGRESVLSLPFRLLPEAERIALANPDQPAQRTTP